MDKLSKVLTHILNTLMWIIGFVYILTSGGFVTGVALTILIILLAINFQKVKESLINYYTFSECLYFNIKHFIYNFKKKT